MLCVRLAGPMIALHFLGLFASWSVHSHFLGAQQLHRVHCCQVTLVFPT